MIDTTVRIGDLFTGATLALLVWGGSRIYRAITNHFEHQNRVEDVVDTHTEILEKTGWVAREGYVLPRVGQQGPQRFRKKL
jgi:hypothetical protein